MDTQQMLNKIYEKYADKTLSFGCKIGRYESENNKELKIGTYINHYVGDEYTSMYRVYTPKGIMRIDIEWDLTYIGHPITLARVLSVLDTSRKNGHIETHQYKDGSFLIFTDKSNMPVCGRKLLNENGSDATLDDQSDETIQAIYNILFPTT